MTDSADDLPVEAEIVDDDPRMSTLEMQMHIEQWSAPFPPPAVMRQYAEIVPDFPERFLRQWESQGQHRQELEKLVVTAQAKTQVRAQPYTLALGGIALACATVLGLAGQTWLAGAIVTLDFTGIGAAFIVSRKREEKELKDKAEQVPEEPAPPRPKTSKPPPKALPTQRAPQNRNRGQNKNKRR